MSTPSANDGSNSVDPSAAVASTPASFEVIDVAEAVLAAVEEDTPFALVGLPELPVVPVPALAAEVDFAVDPAPPAELARAAELEAIAAEDPPDSVGLPSPVASFWAPQPAAATKSAKNVVCNPRTIDGRSMSMTTGVAGTEK
jgi:hypothetical protein